MTYSQTGLDHVSLTVNMVESNGMTTINVIKFTVKPSTTYFEFVPSTILSTKYLPRNEVNFTCFMEGSGHI